MARVINANYSTIVGTPEQIKKLLGLLRGDAASVVNLDYSNFVVLDKPVTAAQIAHAIETTPRKQKAR